MNKVKQLLMLIIWITLVGCSTTVINANKSRIALPRGSSLGIVPMENHTQTPQAGEKVAAIAAGILQTRGLNSIKIYQRQDSCDKILTCPTLNLSQTAMLNWARKNNVDYVMIGTVNEWSYKVGLDGEPEINVTLKLINKDSGGTVWSAIGSKTGGSRSGLGNIGHELIEKMLSSLLISN